MSEVPIDTMTLSHGTDSAETGEARPLKIYKRAYKACMGCRKSKAKCEPSLEPNTCWRCVREHRECCFPEQRSVRRRKVPTNSALSHEEQRAEGASTITVVASMADSGDPTVDRRPIRAMPSSMPLLYQPPVFPSADASSSVDSSNTRNSQETLSTASTGRQEVDATLHDDVVRTIFSSSNDARNILFKAADQEDTDDSEGQDNCPTATDRTTPTSALTSSNYLTPRIATLSHVTKEEMNLWAQHRFVRQQWFTAQEAVTYIDLFFQNLAPLSPVIDLSLADHKNHAQLIVEEPLLCCTLLMISSRYHLLPGYNSSSRAEYIHLRLWKYCEHLISRIMFGAEKYSTARTRTAGSIQALLLIIEWHPRTLRFPPENDGWDHSLAPGVDDSYGYPQGTQSANSARWREEVFEPAKRSDRMSWSLVGLATTLAHELGVFEDGGDDVELTGLPQKTRVRIQRLLFIYIRQLTLRLGCTSIFPQSCHLSTNTQTSTTTIEERCHHDQEVLLVQYINITKLLEAATNMFFPSKSVARQNIRSGRYHVLLEHILPLLESWYRNFTALELSTVSDGAKQLILLEYYYAVMYVNCVGLQAFVEKASDHGGYEGLFDAIGIQHSEHSQYLIFNDAVREAGCQVLSIAIKLGEDGSLRYCPVRLFVRLVASSVFLLKSLSLGARNNNMLHSLEILNRCNQMLKENQHDNVHLSAQYSTLIGRLVRRFKRNVRMQTGVNVSKVASPQRDTARPQAQSQALNAGDFDSTDMLGNVNYEPGDQSGFPIDTGFHNDDWFAQPFDPSLAPFGTEMTAGASGLAPESLDFFWSLPLD